MRNALDVDLEDEEFFAEIALLTDLMVAAAQATGPLTQEAIDTIVLDGG